MLGYRWGEPARSQAVHHASIGLRAACLRVRFAAGPPVRCARRLRPGPTAARDRDRPGGQASATGRCGRSSTGRRRRHQGRCASSLRVRTEDPAARAESAGSRHRARRCPVIPGCAGRRPAGRARNRGAAGRIDAQSRGARATIAGKGQISSVETSSRSVGRGGQQFAGQLRAHQRWVGRQPQHAAAGRDRRHCASTPAFFTSAA